MKPTDKWNDLKKAVLANGSAAAKKALAEHEAKATAAAKKMPKGR